MVGERQHLVADDLPGLVTLAGDDDDIAGAEHADTGGDRLGAVADLAGARRGDENFGADRLGALGARVVVGDDDDVGLLDRDDPMIGRLPLSRSPPQPMTQMSLPVAKGRSASSTAASASGLCA